MTVLATVLALSLLWPQHKPATTHAQIERVVGIRRAWLDPPLTRSRIDQVLRRIPRSETGSTPEEVEAMEAKLGELEPLYYDYRLVTRLMVACTSRALSRLPLGRSVSVRILIVRESGMERLRSILHELNVEYGLCCHDGNRTGRGKNGRPYFDEIGGTVARQGQRLSFFLLLRGTKENLKESRDVPFADSGGGELSLERIRLAN